MLTASSTSIRFIRLRRYWVFPLISDFESSPTSSFKEEPVAIRRLKNQQKLGSSRIEYFLREYLIADGPSSSWPFSITHIRPKQWFSRQRCRPPSVGVKQYLRFRHSSCTLCTKSLTNTKSESVANTISIFHLPHTEPNVNMLSLYAEFMCKFCYACVIKWMRVFYMSPYFFHGS